MLFFIKLLRFHPFKICKSQDSAGRVLLHDFPFDFMLTSNCYFCDDKEQGTSDVSSSIGGSQNIVGILITACSRTANVFIKRK